MCLLPKVLSPNLCSVPWTHRQVHRQKRWKDAEADSVVVLQMAPDRSAGYVLRAQALVGQQLFKRAAAELELAVCPLLIPG